MSKKKSSYRLRIYEALDLANPKDRLSLWTDRFIIGLILLNALAVIFETVESLATKYGIFFETFEIISVTIFTVEYLLRLWACTINPKWRHPILGRLKFISSPFSVIDLLAIFPFYAPLFFAVDLRFLRIFRLLRLFKLARYSRSLRRIRAVLHKKKDELVISLSTIIILLIIASSAIYFIENKAQPETFSSIPAAMWWGVATLTTVGYGDIYPITPVGKLLGAAIAILGIGIFALPTSILASGFSEELKAEESICSQCKAQIKD